LRLIFAPRWHQKPADHKDEVGEKKEEPSHHKCNDERGDRKMKSQKTQWGCNFFKGDRDIIGTKRGGPGALEKIEVLNTRSKKRRVR